MTTTTTIRFGTEWCYRPGITHLDPQRAGFWRSLLGPRYAQDVWAKVSAVVRAGQLGPAARLRPIANGRAVELRVYVSDIADRAEVDRIRRALWRLDFKHPIACYTWDGRRRYYDRGAHDKTPKELWRPRR